MSENKATTHTGAALSILDNITECAPILSVDQSMAFAQVHATLAVAAAQREVAAEARTANRIATATAARHATYGDTSTAEELAAIGKRLGAEAGA